ncbi:MAG: undecaprenyl-diphosphatase UppP [Nitrospirae bacterium]|nr:undecaprenyl-diphosphatase UppP [Nitrospirota bacterium]
MFQAIILGIVQGLAEFLPISSSAHLIILPWFFGWDGVVNTLGFGVALHFGTLLALLVYFRDDWITILKTSNRKDGLIWNILLGTVPAGVTGLLFHDNIEHIRSPLLIVFTLCIVAVFMIMVERSYKESSRIGVDKIRLKDALIIGIAQAFALVPGVSRSGITIVAGIMLGFQRQASARFSFLLSTPIVAGASLLEAKNLINSPDIKFNIFIAGTIASAVTGYIAIKYLLRFLQTHSLRPFAYYRFFLAFAIIIGIWIGLTK